LFAKYYDTHGQAEHSNAQPLRFDKKRSALFTANRLKAAAPGTKTKYARYLTRISWMAIFIREISTAAGEAPPQL